MGYAFLLQHWVASACEVGRMVSTMEEVSGDLFRVHAIEDQLPALRHCLQGSGSLIEALDNTLFPEDPFIRPLLHHPQQMPSAPILDPSLLIVLSTNTLVPSPSFLPEIAP